MSTQDLPDIAGKTVLITGGNKGLGFETAKALASVGARVILAVRDVRRQASDPAAARQLWQISEDLTGVSFPQLPA